MLALSITDPTLKRLLVEHLIEQLERGGDGLDYLLSAGVDPEQLDRLRHTPARDLIQIAQMDQLDIRAGFGDNSISNCLDRVAAVRRDALLMEYFVRNGASVDSVVTLFRVTKEAVRDMRRQLTPGAPLSVSAGRPSLPPTAKRQKVHEHWAEVQRVHFAQSQRERYYQLHLLHSDISIAEMLSTLNEFSTPRVVNDGS